jgi:hypothetical protein
VEVINAASVKSNLSFGVSLPLRNLKPYTQTYVQKGCENEILAEFQPENPSVRSNASSCGEQVLNRNCR